jgi:S-layer protein
VGTTTMAQVNADITSNGGLANTLNGYYASSFGSVANATVAASVATNLGLTGDALASGTAYITAQLNGAAAGARGAVISNILDLFAGLASDATFGAAATAWNAKVNAANAYTGAANVAIGSTVGQGTAFTLTTGVDSVAGTAGNDTINATDSTFTLGDSIQGDAGTDTFALSTTAAYSGLPTGASISGVENIIINGAAAITASFATNAGVTSLTTATSGANATDLTGSAAQNLNASVTGATTTTSGITTTGGKDVTITYGSLLATGATGSVLASSGAAGTVTVNATQTSAAVGDGNATTGGAINVTGGSSVNVTQNIAATAAAAAALVTGNASVTHTGGKVTVTGGTATKDVTVTQTATVAAVKSTTIGREGIAAGAVDVLDANRASTTAAGTVETVTLTNAGAAVVNSGALKTLNIGGTLTTVNAGTLGALTTAANSTLALNLTGAVSTGAVTIDNDIKTLNVSGNTTASTLNSLVADGATTINVSGDAKVTLTGNTTGAVTAINVTNTKGAVFGTAIGAGVTFTGGAGDDGVVLSDAFTKAHNMGAGNDSVTYGGAASTTTGAVGSMNAGEGTDTIVMTDAQAAAADGTSAFNASFTNFEILRVSDAFAEDALDLDGINGVGQVILAAGVTGTAAINNLSSGGTVRINADGAATPALTVGVKSSVLGAADVLNLTLSKTGGVLAAGSVTAANVETINIATPDAAVAPALGSNAVTHTLTLAATSATTVTVAGNNGLTLTNTNNDKITRFDASGVVANNTAASTYVAATTDGAAELAVTFASANTTASANVTIIGGAGNDTLSGTIAKDNISGGAGGDIIYADNAGTKAKISSTDVTYAATKNLSVSIFGINVAVTQATDAKTSIEALAAKVNADTTLNKLVKASIGGADKQLIVDFLVDGDNTAVVTADTTAQTPTKTTAGTAGTVAIDTIDGGAGADFIVGGGGADVITTGAGADSVFFLKAHSNLATMATITDYNYAVGGASNDRIILGDVTTASGTIKTVQDLSSSASLAAALTAAAVNNTVDLGLSMFIFGGDTYAYVETTGATATYQATDFVVKLTGLPLAAGTSYLGAGFDAVTA